MSSNERDKALRRYCDLTQKSSFSSQAASHCETKYKNSISFLDKPSWISKDFHKTPIIKITNKKKRRVERIITRELIRTSRSPLRLKRTIKRIEKIKLDMEITKYSTMCPKSIIISTQISSNNSNKSKSNMDKI